MSRQAGASPSEAPKTAAAVASEKTEDVEHLILEAEQEDLVVIGNAANCSSWIGQAISDSHFVAIVKTPMAPSTSVIIDAKLAEEANIKREVLQRRWVAFRARRKVGDPRLPLKELSALCDQMVQAGVEPRTLVPIDSRSYLLLCQEHVQASVAALVQCGHIVSPLLRVVPPMKVPEASPELPEPQVGAWQLVQRRRSGTVEDLSTADPLETRTCTLRLQAKCGLYAEVRVSSEPESFHAQHSSFGTLRLESGGQLSSRDAAVTFQPSTGFPPPQLRLSQSEPLFLEEETVPGNSATAAIIEKWSKLAASEKVTALELDPSQEGLEGRVGLWMFGGNLFLRVVGLPQGRGLVGNHCCRSLAQLESFHGATAVQSELAKYFQAVVGEVVQPGVLRVRRETWTSEVLNDMLLDARPNEADAPTAGSAEVQLEKSCILHKDPSGTQWRWLIREWGFDPFTLPEPSEAPAEESAPMESGSESDSASESVSTKQKKNLKAQKKGAASKARPKPATKSDASASPPPKKRKKSDDSEQKKSDDSEEEEETKKEAKKAEPEDSDEEVEQIISKKKKKAAKKDSDDESEEEPKKKKKKHKKKSEDSEEEEETKKKKKKEKKKSEDSEEEEEVKKKDDEKEKKDKKKKDKDRKKAASSASRSSSEVKKKKKKEKEKKDKEKDKDKEKNKDRDRKKRSKSRRSRSSRSKKKKDRSRSKNKKKDKSKSRKRSASKKKAELKKRDGSRRRNRSASGKSRGRRRSPAERKKSKSKESSSSPVIVKASKEKKDEPEVKKVEEVKAASSPPRQQSPVAQKEEAKTEPVKEVEESPKKETKEVDAGMGQEEKKAEATTEEAAKAAPAGDDREERLQKFAERSGLIPQAMEALRNLKPDLQDKIMEEGPIKPGCNPIIVLMNRIKEVANRAQQDAERTKEGAGNGEEKPQASPQAPERTPEEEPGAKKATKEAPAAAGQAEEASKATADEPAEDKPDISPEDLAMYIRAFAQQNVLSDKAQQLLKDLPAQVALRVLQSGPLEAKAGDSFAALQARLEEVLQDPAMAQHMLKRSDRKPESPAEKASEPKAAEVPEPEKEKKLEEPPADKPAPATTPASAPAETPAAAPAASPAAEPAAPGKDEAAAQAQAPPQDDAQPADPAKPAEAAQTQPATETAVAVAQPAAQAQGDQAQLQQQQLLQQQQMMQQQQLQQQQMMQQQQMQQQQYYQQYLQQQQMQQMQMQPGYMYQMQPQAGFVDPSMYQQGYMQVQPGYGAVMQGCMPGMPQQPGPVNAQAIQQAQATQMAQQQAQAVQQTAQQAQQTQAAQQAQGKDQLAEFCRSNGVGADVEKVLRDATPELQARVMAEGPLQGPNPSDVLIARVKRIMGQS